MTVANPPAAAGALNLDFYRIKLHHDTTVAPTLKADSAVRLYGLRDLRLTADWRNQENVKGEPPSGLRHSFILCANTEISRPAGLHAN